LVLLHHALAVLFAISRCARAAIDHVHIVKPQRNVRWIEFRTAAVADRADDPPQIWIGREKCSLHQRRVCDRECDSARLRRAPAFGTVSVVMIASAASSHASLRSAEIAAGNASSMRSTASGSMMTPVEKGNTCSRAQLIRPATAAQLLCAASSPAPPVPALA